MKKLLIALVSGLLAISLSGCGSNKKVESREESKLGVKAEEQIKEEKEKEELEKVYKLLESDVSYSEFDSGNKELVSTFLDTDWDNHSDDVKEKFLNRKNEYHEYWQNKKNEILAGSNGVNSSKVILSENDKNKIKKDIEERLKDKNVTSVDVLTNSATGKAMLSIQLVGNILKKDVNSNEAKELCEGIYNKLKDVTEEITIELVDKNYQLISIYTNGIFEMR